MASHHHRLPPRTFGIADQNIYAVLAQESHLRFEVLIGGGMRIFVVFFFWDVTTCNLVDHY